MDLWKWVTVAAAALLGVFVFLGIVQRPDFIPVPQTNSGVENGSFVLERGNVRLVQESFLLSMAGQLIDLHSNVTVHGAHQTTRFTQRLRLSSNFDPLRYFRDAQASSVQQTVLVELEDVNVRVNRFSDGQAQERQLSGTPPFVILDDNVISHYLLLYRYVRQKAIHGQRFTGTAIMPQAMQAEPLEAQLPVPATLKSGGRLIPVEKILVQMGTTQFILYGKGETLFGVEFPAQQSIAYRNDLLKDGIDAIVTP